MKDLRIIHTADWHSDSDPVKSKKLEESLKQMVEFCEHNEVNAIIHAGDVWERNQNYDGKSGVPLVQKYLKLLADYVDFIFIVKGNNSHDAPGSIELLNQLEVNIIASETLQIIGIDGDKTDDLLGHYELAGSKDGYDYIVSLVPYPTKGNLVNNTSIDNNNAGFIEKFEQIFELIGSTTEYYTCPKLLAFHGNVVGSRLSSGQSLVSQDIMVAPATLLKAKADYYALGHIHLRQEVAENMVYSGSIYNKSWGETEQKSFEFVQFVPSVDNITGVPVYLRSSPMVSLNATYNAANELQIEGGISLEELDEFKQYRLKVQVSEADRKLISEDDIEYWRHIVGSSDLKIDFNIIPTERESRSEVIMSCKSLSDEVREYASVISEDLPESVFDKVAKLEGDSL